MTALVCAVQRYTIHDGPGIRTEIFFAGCPLRCVWCSNPETMEPVPRLGIYPNKCVGRDKCTQCTSTCPHSDDSPLCFGNDEKPTPKVFPRSCAECLKCAKNCPSRAIMVWAKSMTQTELLDIILKDMSFYKRTQGGLTLSGGEVMMQWKFARDLLKECHNRAINTCIESSLFCDTDAMQEVYNHTDFVITDIKHMDPEKHKEYTGADNGIILSNIIKTVQLQKKLVIRTPVVPGYNDSDENILATGNFIRRELGNKVLQYQLLPYMPLGTEKYASLGLSYPIPESVQIPRKDREPSLNRLASMLREIYGINAVVGSAGKWPDTQL